MKHQRLTRTEHCDLKEGGIHRSVILSDVRVPLKLGFTLLRVISQLNLIRIAGSQH